MINYNRCRKNNDNYTNDKSQYDIGPSRGDVRDYMDQENVLTTNRLTLTFGVRGDSLACEPRDSKRALRLLADSMLDCSPVPWAISISAT